MILEHTFLHRILVAKFGPDVAKPMRLKRCCGATSKVVAVDRRNVFEELIMKNLVFCGVVAALASQAAGCIFVSDDTVDGYLIDSTWNYKINNVIQPGCPNGVNEVRVYIQSQTTGQEDVLVAGCGARTIGDYFVSDTYSVSVDLLGPGIIYQSNAVILDIVSDQQITFDIHEDRGYFSAQWTLKGANSNVALSCGQVADLDFIGLLSTKVGPIATAVDSRFPCADGIGVSKPTEVGLHSVKIDAANRSNQSLGGVEVLTNQPIGDRNRVTVLGSVVIPIALR